MAVLTKKCYYSNTPCNFISTSDNDIFGDLAKVSVKHKLGWQLAISASAFTLFGVFLNWIVALVMMIQTDTGMYTLYRGHL